MAHPKNTEAAADLGDALTALWEAHDRPQYRKIERAILIDSTHPELMPSNNTIGRMHHGDVDPWTCPVEHLVALARYYGVNSDKLGVEAAGRLGDLLAFTQNWKKMRAGRTTIHRTGAPRPCAA